MWAGGSSQYHQAAYQICSPVIGDSYYPSLPACHYPARCSTKNTPTSWTMYPWGWFSPGFPPLNNEPYCGSPEQVGLSEQVPFLQNSQLKPFSRNPLSANLPWAVSTLVLTVRPNQPVH